MKKLRFWILAVVLSLITAFSVGFLIPQLLYDEVAATEIDYIAKKEKIVEDFSEELLVMLALESKRTEAKAKEQTETQASEPTAEDDPDTTPSQEDTDQVDESQSDKTSTTTSQTETTDTKTQTLTKTVTPTKEEKKSTVKVDNEWLQAEIDKNIESIDMSDLERGAAIFERLDTKYLFDLADGGLTDEEKLLYDAYLDAQLTPEEKRLVKVLYDKYVGLLND